MHRAEVLWNQTYLSNQFWGNWYSLPYNYECLFSWDACHAEIFGILTYFAVYLNRWNLMFFLFIIYPTLSMSCLRTFVCQPVGKATYLVADYRQIFYILTHCFSFAQMISFHLRFSCRESCPYDYGAHLAGLVGQAQVRSWLNDSCVRSRDGNYLNGVVNECMLLNWFKLCWSCWI